MFKFGRDRTAEVEVTIANKTIFRVIGIALAAYLILAAVWQAKTALELVFTAFFLSLALNAPVQWLANKMPKKYSSRTLATVVSSLVVVLALAAFLASLVPPIVSQTENFIKEAPGYVADARDKNSEIGKFISKYKLGQQVDNISKDLSNKLDNVSGVAVDTLTSIGVGLFKFVTVLVMTFMMLVEGPRWVRLASRLMPAGGRKRTGKIARDMYKVVKGYVNGQVTLAALAAALMLPMLFILGISYPFALAVIVFISGLIPMIGHYIGATIVTLVALFHSPVAAIIVLAYYILYQQIENYAIQPKLQANNTNLSPLLVFISVIVGASFGGLLGALVAIPIMGCVRVLVIDLLKQRDMLPEPADVKLAAAKANDTK